MNRYSFSPDARRDIREIWEYVAADSVKAAGRVRRRIQAHCRVLANRPLIGHQREDLTTRTDVRFWPVYSYLIVYRPHTNPLEILRVLHSKRDVGELMRQ